MFLNHLIGKNTAVHKEVSSMVEFLTLPDTGFLSCILCPRGFSLTLKNSWRQAISWYSFVYTKERQDVKLIQSGQTSGNSLKLRNVAGGKPSVCQPV